MKKIFCILLIYFSISLIFSQTMDFSEKEKIIFDFETPCTFDFLVNFENEAKSQYAPDDIIFAVLAERKAILFEENQDFENAINEFSNSIRIYHNNNDIESVDFVTNEYLYFLDTTKCYTKNKTIFDSAFSIFIEIEDFSMKSENWKNLQEEQIFVLCDNILTECQKYYEENYILYAIIDFLCAENHSSYKNLGLRIKKYISCIKILENQISKNELKIANAYFSFGFFCRTHAITDFAMNYIIDSLEIYKTIYGEYNINTLKTYLMLADIYLEKMQTEESELYIEKVCKIAPFVEEYKDIAEELSFLLYGRFYFIQGDYDKSLKYSEKAKNLLQSRNANDSSLPNVIESIGMCYAEKGDYNRALAYYDEALSLYNKIYGKNTTRSAHIFASKAMILKEMGEVEKSFDLILKSLQYKQILGNLISLDGFYTLMISADIITEYDKGGKFESMLTDEERENLLASCKNSFLDELKALQEATNQNDFELDELETLKDVAICIYQFITIFNSFINPSGDNLTINAYIKLGKAYNCQGKYENAMKSYNSAYNLSVKKFGENHTYLGDIYSEIANVFVSQKNEQKAIEYYRKAYNCWKNSAQYVEIINYLNDILSQNISNNDFIKETIDFTIEITEKARLDMISIKSRILKKSLPVYYYGVNFAFEKGDAKLAFEYSEKMKSRGFLDQMGTEAALNLDGVTQNEREQVRELSTTIEIARKRIERFEKNDKQKSSIVRKTLTKGKKEDTFEDVLAVLFDAENRLLDLDRKIAQRLPKYAELRNPKTVTLTEAQKWCGKNRALVEYVLWSDDFGGKNAKIKNSYCVVVTQNESFVLDLTANVDYTKMINDLRNSIIAQKNEESYEHERNILYSFLIEPILPFIKNKSELVIVPDGSLAFLPFDILRKDKNSEDFGVAFILSPSISVSMMSDKNANGSKNALGFGGAWYDKSLAESEHREILSLKKSSFGANRGQIKIQSETSSSNKILQDFLKGEILRNGPGVYFEKKNILWQDLPGTVFEINLLKNTVFKKDDLFEIMQENASEKNLKTLSLQGKLRDYSVLHFACHGYFDPNIAEMSSIVFSEVSGKIKSTEDGYLTIGEATLLDLNADLVCLSACETGMGEIKAGNGMVGISRSFMIAGAKRVGVSLWSVDDEATAEFMARMYKKQSLGKSYIDAYREVKAEFRKHQKWSKPYYWAAFTLYGY